MTKKLVPQQRQFTCMYKGEKKNIKEVNYLGGGYVEFDTGEQVGIEFVQFDDRVGKETEWRNITKILPSDSIDARTR